MTLTLKDVLIYCYFPFYAIFSIPAVIRYFYILLTANSYYDAIANIEDDWCVIWMEALVPPSRRPEVKDIMVDSMKKSYFKHYYVRRK